MIYIILTRNDPPTLYVASALASSYVALGEQVTLFISGSAILAFRRNPQVSDVKEHELYVNAKVDYVDLIRVSKSVGGLRVIACSGVMSIYGVDKGDLSDVVDDVLDFPALVMGIKDSDKLIVV